MKVMIKYKCIIAIFYGAICFVLSACSNYTADKSQAIEIKSDSASKLNQHNDTSSTDNLTVRQNELTKIYTQAISEFIKAEYKKDKTRFDSLFFGKHVYGQPDDFPDIELPEKIENTHLRLINPEVGLIMQKERKTLVYINMMGWVDKEKAEFKLVVFSNGGEHQYDYSIDFTYNAARSDFELEKIQFENYLHIKGEKPKRITIYEGGKYVGDKSN